MPQRGRLTLAEKIKAVEECLNGIDGVCGLAQKYGVSDTTIRNWVRLYKALGAIGLKSVIRRKRPNYIKSTPEITAENILDRKFTAQNLNEKWLTDITEFKYIDNGPMEAFWGTLKAEIYYLHRFLDYDSLKVAIEQYIHFYNSNSCQVRLGDLAPMEYRIVLQTAA